MKRGGVLCAEDVLSIYLCVVLQRKKQIENRYVCTGRYIHSYMIIYHTYYSLNNTLPGVWYHATRLQVI